MKKTFPSRLSIIGAFAVLSFILTIPIIVLFSQQSQSTQSSAAVPTPTIQVPLNSLPFGSISGYIYNDINQNGQRDPGETGFPNAAITVSVLINGKQNSREIPVYRTLTDRNGYFIYRLSGTNPQDYTYFITLTPPSGYKTLNSNPVLFTNLQKDSTEVVQFGLYSAVSQTPKATCMQKPACLESNPPCVIPQPTSGWCSGVIISPYQPKITPVIEKQIPSGT
jgi:hypothetical protein